jgi:hypothetical protein
VITHLYVANNGGLALNAKAGDAIAFVFMKDLI